MVKDPCDKTRVGGWVRVRRRPQVERDLQKSGKWLIFLDCPHVERVWARVVADVRAGLLGPDAKVSTHKSPPQPGKHVICVYTESFEDKDDLLRVAKQLVTTAELKKGTIHYKRDLQTLAGEYQGTSGQPVALYSFKWPYRDLVEPRVMTPPKPCDEYEGCDDDERLFNWPYCTNS